MITEPKAHICPYGNYWWASIHGTVFIKYLPVSEFEHKWNAETEILRLYKNEK